MSRTIFPWMRVARRIPDEIEKIQRKRVAICLYGQTRPGSIHAIPNILRYIGALRSECDIFIHTWDEETLGTSYAKRMEEGTKPTDSHWHSPHATPSDRFSTIFNAYKPRVFEVEEYSLQPTKSTWGGRRFDPVRMRWDVSMWRSIQEVNQMKMKYAAKNRLQYEYTVVLRSDIVFGPTKRLSEDIQQLRDPDMLLFGDHMTVWPTYRMKRIEEVIWIGPTPVIDKVAFFSDHYTSTVANIDDPKHPGYRDWQFYAADWIVNTLKYTFAPLTDNTMKPYTQADYDAGVDPLNPGFSEIRRYQGSHGVKRIVFITALKYNAPLHRANGLLGL